MAFSSLLLCLGITFANSPFVRSAVIAEKRQSDLSIMTLAGWQSLGCWSDTQANRTLGVMAHSGQHVSDDNCQYQCQQLNYNYAGTEYAGQCFCGNEVNSISTQEPDSDCDMACTFNSSQPCGGPDRMNLFWNGQTASPSVPISTNPGVDGWAYEGCYTDSVAARTLGHEVDTTGGGSSMTIQLCVDACSSAGYTLAGAEYSGQCYCDNAFTNGGLASDQTICNMACNGNASEYCGGAGALDLYSIKGATPVLAVSSSSSAVPTITPTLASSWATLGCYSDTNGQRALANFFAQPSGGMTVETCIGICSSNGYTIAGVEYGSECWCDNIVKNNHGLAEDGSTGCNMACSGNAGETCGGPNRLNAYAAGPGWVQLGCFTDQPYSRTLSYSADSDDNSMTVDTCLSTCSTAGYPYAGVEYGVECHCGNSFNNGGGPAPDGSAGCSFSCAGNSSEICGGNQRLSLYEFIQANGAVASTAPSATATTSTSTSSIPATPAPITGSLPSGFSHQGCYVDNTNGRILAVQQPDSSSLTVEGCISTCTAAGYSIAGVEYSSQCFCGNDIVNGGTLASASVASSQCTMACSGNATEACGGPGLMDIYSASTPTFEAAPVAQTTDLPSGWTYVGCISDNVGQRTLPNEQDVNGVNNATVCLSSCSSQGYSVGGMEYTSQCFCGTVDDVSSSGASSSTDCNMACNGDSAYLCGGPGALTYYTFSQS